MLSLATLRIANVSEAQRPIQTRLSIHRAVGDFRLPSRYAEALVEVREKLFQNGPGLFDGGRTRKTKLGYKSVREKSSLQSFVVDAKVTHRQLEPRP